MKLLQRDLNLVVSRLPKDVSEFLKTNHGKFFLGGGFIRSTILGEKPSDIDLFGHEKESIIYEAGKLSEARKARSHKTCNAITLLTHGRTPIQFITRWCYDNPESLLRSFDFTIAQAVVWAEKNNESNIQWMSLTCDSYYADLAGKLLVYTSPQREEESGGSLMRVRKFLSKGYKILAPEFASVIARAVMKVRWDEVFRSENPEEKASLAISGILREVDPLHIVDGVEMSDEIDNV